MTRSAAVSEADAFTTVLERIGREAITALAGVPDDALNRAPALPDTISMFAIGTHLAAAAEFWVLALAGGRRVERDRPAEFHATGHGPALIDRIERWIGDVNVTLTDLPAARLNEIADPPAA